MKRGAGRRGGNSFNFIPKSAIGKMVFVFFVIWVLSKIF